MFTQFQSQQRSSAISAIPRHYDNKQTATACPAETDFPFFTASAKCLSSTGQISHTIASCPPSSSVPLKRPFPVSSALSPTPTHCLGAAKAVTKLLRQLGTWSRPLHWRAPAAGRALPGRAGVRSSSACGEEGEACRQPREVIHSSPLSTFLLRWLRSLPYTCSADRLQRSSKGQRSCSRPWGRQPAGLTSATSPKRTKSGATASHRTATVVGRKGSGLLPGSIASQFCNSMNSTVKVKKKKRFIYLLAESNVEVSLEISALERRSCWGSLLLFQLWKLTTGIRGRNTGGAAENWRKWRSHPFAPGSGNVLAQTNTELAGSGPAGNRGNHVILEAGRDFWRSSSPTSWSQQG